MTQKFKKLLINHLDKGFERVYCEPKPKSGWIKTIRKALSMPLSFPANRLNISPQGFSQLEKSEIEETITLKSLRSIAESMDCELHYSIIPHAKSLNKVIDDRARKRAIEIVGEVDKTMVLEDQNIQNLNESIDDIAKNLSENINSKLWRND